MKYDVKVGFEGYNESHPARGAWVEINGFPRCVLIPWGRTPQGVRGLKLSCPYCVSCPAHVAPRKGCVG